MTGGSVAAAAVSVLSGAPAGGYTVEEIVAILREQHGFAPSKAYYDVVYGGLMTQFRAGKVTRRRDRNKRGVWSWSVAGE